MKKFRNRISIILIAILTCIMMMGCSAGSIIYTTLKINEDLSGVREMNVEIDGSVFNEYFTGTYDDLNNTIANNCPSDLTYSCMETDGVMTYQFQLAFSSPEDYQQKVRNITGQENVITINTPDTVWASGFYINEDFTSATLLDWLKQAIINDGLVSSSNASKIFSDGSSTVIFGGEEFSAGSNINVDTIDFLSIESIDLLTKVNEINSYDRTLVFTVSSDTMQQKGEEIKAFFEEHLPITASSEWTEDENGASVYTVSLAGLTAEGITAMDATIFGTDASAFTVTEVVEDLSTFTFAYEVSENIDLSQYIASDSQNVRITSYISLADTILYGENAYNVEEITVWYTESEKHPGYYAVVENNVWGGYPYKDTYSIEKKYSVKELDLVTKREMVFAFDKVPTEAEQEMILVRLQTPFGMVAEEAATDEADTESMTEETLEDADTTEEETSDDVAAAEEEETDSTQKSYNIKFKNKVKDNAYTLTIEQKGASREIEEMTKILTGYNSEVSYGEKFAFSKVKYDEVYTESIRMGELLYNTTEDFICNYEVNLGFGSKINSVSREDAIIDGNKMTVTSSSVPSSVYVVSQKLNLWAIAFYILLIAGIVCVGIAVKKSGIIKKPVKMVAEPTAEGATVAAPTTEVSATVATPATETSATVEAPVTETATPSPATEEPAQEKVTAAFCENCGAPRDADACVCVKCGTKF